MESADVRYKRLLTEKEELSKKLKETAKEAFLAGATEVFDRFAGLESFGWRQYTPYFNDGDACHFGVRADEPEINGEDSDEFSRGYTYKHNPTTGRYERVESGQPDPRLEWADAVTKFVNSFPKDDMESMFGDHVRVTVHRDGRIETKEYSHD